MLAKDTENDNKNKKVEKEDILSSADSQDTCYTQFI